MFDVIFREDDLKKIETCQSISGSYVKVCILIILHLLVLAMKLFIDAWI